MGDPLKISPATNLEDSGGDGERNLQQLAKVLVATECSQ